MPARSLRHFAFLTAALYVIFAAGYIDTIDATPSVQLAQSLWRSGSIQFQPPVVMDGHHYKTTGFTTSKMGLGYPLLYLPVVAFADLLSKLLPGIDWTSFLVSLVNPLVTAGIVTVLLAFFLSQGVRMPAALGMASISAFATLLLPYSKTSCREPLQALCLLMVFVSGHSRSRRSCLVAGAFAGLGLFTKQVFLVALLPALGLAAINVWRDRRGREDRRMRLLLIGAPVCLAGLLLLLYAYFAFGSPWTAGYSAQVETIRGKAWSHPFLWGLYQQLLSPYRGLLYFDPIAFCGFLLCLVAAVRKQRLEAAILLSLVAQVCLYAKWSHPGESLGPRFLVVIVPSLCLAFRNLQGVKRSWGTRVAGALVVWGFALQLVNSSVKSQQYFSLVGNAPSISQPQWVVNARLFVHKLKAGNEVYNPSDFGGRGPLIDLSSARTLNGLNFWWLHFYAVRNRPNAKLPD